MDGGGVLFERDEVVAVVEAVLPPIPPDGVIQPFDGDDAERDDVGSLARIGG